MAIEPITRPIRTSTGKPAEDEHSRSSKSNVGAEGVIVASDEELIGVKIIAEGDGFLYNMVRILAGTLLEVACGLRTIEATAGA